MFRIIFFGVFFLSLAVPRAWSFGAGHVEITTRDGRFYRFNVEIAASAEDRARGLMFRNGLPSDSGMLFLFPEEQSVAFWMKNTWIPLDLVFIGQDGTVLQIAKNAEPFSERLIPSLGPVQAVLEINGGLADQLPLAPGDKAVFIISRKY